MLDPDTVWTGPLALHETSVYSVVSVWLCLWFVLRVWHYNTVI